MRLTAVLGRRRLLFLQQALRAHDRPGAARERTSVEFMVVAPPLDRFPLAHRPLAFNKHFDHYYNRWAALNFNDLPPHELMQIYHDMEKHLLRNWKTALAR